MNGKGFFAAVVRRRRRVLAGYAAAAVLCALLSLLVSVNYDINDYLPPDAPSTTAIHVMEDAFSGGIPNVRAMARDVTVPEALALKQQIARVDGVTSVTWLDDVAEITVPLEMQDPATVEAYYKDGAALFTITVADDQRAQAVAAIDGLLGDAGALTGSAVSTAAATNSTVVEVAQIAAVAVLYVFFILGLTTASWAEPVLIMLGMGAAILINNGTNLIFGEISFVTSAAGSILQLAVSLDRPGADPGDCMVEALTKSASSILSSGLTTVIGFAALVLMQFQIGPDLGLALAKGVAFSLLTVFTFVPALVVTALPWMDKTCHKPLLPAFTGFGRLVSRIMLPMVAVLAIIMVPSYLASGANEYYYGAGHMFAADTEVGRDTQAIEEVFGQSDTYVLLVPAGDTATQSQLSAALHALPQVTGILSYVDTAGAEIPPGYLDDATLSQLVSNGTTRMVLSVAADFEGDAAFALVEQVRAIAQQYYPDSWYLAGQGVSTYDLMDTITGDMAMVNFVAIAAVFLVLLLLERSLILPIVLVLCIETAIWFNLALPYFTGTVVFYIAYLIISSVQLGATVDYAILFSDRYREYRQTLDKKPAIVATVATVTTSVLTTGSGLAVVGFLMGAISSNQLLAQLGNFLGVGSLASLTIVLLALPGILYLIDPLIVHPHPKEGTAL